MMLLNLSKKNKNSFKIKDKKKLRKPKKKPLKIIKKMIMQKKRKKLRKKKRLKINKMKNPILNNKILKTLKQILITLKNFLNFEKFNYIIQLSKNI